MTTQISELGRAQRRLRAAAPESDGAAVPTVEPVPRIALWVVRQRRKRLFPVAKLPQAVDEMCSEPG